MIKHIGKYNNRKLIIVYRTVPSEDHMALVVFTETLPSLVHDACMKVVESAEGQNAKELADALFRYIMADGTNCLESLHKSGHMKKIPTKQIIVTVNASSACRLDELNEIMQKLEDGGEAATKLADLDANAGFARGIKTRDVGEPAQVNNSTEVLLDEDLAVLNINQAKKLKAEADILLTEAKRLEKEAKQFTTTKSTNVRKSATAKKATA
jgi:hypothetical protein